LVRPLLRGRLRGKALAGSEQLGAQRALFVRPEFEARRDRRWKAWEAGTMRVRESDPFTNHSDVVMSHCHNIYRPRSVDANGTRATAASTPECDESGASRGESAAVATSPVLAVRGRRACRNQKTKVLFQGPPAQRLPRRFAERTAKAATQYRRRVRRAELAMAGTTSGGAHLRSASAKKTAAPDSRSEMAVSHHRMPASSEMAVEPADESLECQACRRHR
jgi:hypothetical protein